MADLKRRGLAGAAALAALGAGATLASPASASAEAVSPEIRDRWTRLVAARAALVQEDERRGGLRDRLVARWGEIPPGSSGDRHWGHDPDYPALKAHVYESNRLVGEENDRIEDLLDHPAASVADLACKLAVVLEAWRRTTRLDEYHERMALGFFRDAERALGPLLPVDLKAF